MVQQIGPQERSASDLQIIGFLDAQESRTVFLGHEPLHRHQSPLRPKSLHLEAVGHQRFEVSANHAPRRDKEEARCAEEKAHEQQN